MATTNEGKPYVLGLDLGVASIGWACIGLSGQGEPDHIIRAGVHIFEAGVEGGRGALAEGNEKSKALPRRLARGQRKQTWRRAFRKRQILKRLIRHGLLPKPEKRLATPEDIDAYLKALDVELQKREKWEKTGDDQERHRLSQLLPYRLRAAATERKIELDEIGRALYHLAQRRGFQSNCKTDVLEERPGKKKKNPKQKVTRRTPGSWMEEGTHDGIKTLEEEMRAAGAKTLGEYLAMRNPTEIKSAEDRVRRRWTSRQMYKDEFDLIWQEQARHHSLSDDARKEIYRAIFHQRPLKSQRHLLGRCSLLPDRRRAALAVRTSQEFRMLQQVNALEVGPHLKRDTGKTTKSGKPVYEWIPDGAMVKLNENQRKAVTDLLQHGDATFADVRKVLGRLKPHFKFNFETGGAKTVIGMRTDGRLREIFGSRWDSMCDLERDRAIEDILSIDLPEARKRRARSCWKLDNHAAELFKGAALERGYARHSTAAMKRMLPLLRQGKPYTTAKDDLDWPTRAQDKIYELLPPLELRVGDRVERFFPARLPPTVARALGELRHVVNAIIRRFGKPLKIHIELNRDLRKSKGARKAIQERIERETANRERIKKRLLKEWGIADPSRDDVRKLMLHEECKGLCPYTNTCISHDDLFGSSARVHIEHIWPRAWNDDSYANVTLCFAEENQIKRGRTPRAAYCGTQKYQQILQRVATFQGPFAAEKLRRFKEDPKPDFTDRHLNEASEISLKATEYLSLLYGGVSDKAGTRRVFARPYQLVSTLRWKWGMNAILSPANKKNRYDHRHHAVDAIVVALTNESALQSLTRAAVKAEQLGWASFYCAVDPPWSRAVEEARQAIEAIGRAYAVSHQQRRRAAGLRIQKVRDKNGQVKKKVKHRTVRGKLHDATLYSKHSDGEFRVRRDIAEATDKQLARAVDSKVRRIINDQLAGGKPTAAFADVSNHPQFGGAQIHHVRTNIDKTPKQIGIGKGDRKNRGKSKERYILPEANHHTIIMAKLKSAACSQTLKNGDDEETWEDRCVSLMEVVERFKESNQQSDIVVSREVPEGYRFKFSLAANEFVQLDGQTGPIYRVLSLSEGDNRLQLHSDGQPREEAFKAGTYLRMSGEKLRKRNARKVHVTYLGEVRNAGG